MTIPFLFLVLLGHASSVRSRQPTQPPRNIFILAGQSNMAGRGGVVYDPKTGLFAWNRFVPSQCRSNPSILRLNADLKWVLAHDPLHADIDVLEGDGVGPGMAFANTILTKDKGFGSVGLVPCAIGGTNITQWKKGGFLYDQLMRRTEAALHGGGVIKALLWYQGESDTVTRKEAELYRQRLEKFFKDVRADLLSPKLPIFQVALASGKGRYVNIVRQAQIGIRLSNVHCVDAKGLTLESDRLHLTTRAQVLLGETLANAFLRSLSMPGSW